MVSGAAAPHKLVLQMPVEAAGAVSVVPWVWWWHEEITEPLPSCVCANTKCCFFHLCFVGQADGVQHSNWRSLKIGLGRMSPYC